MIYDIEFAIGGNSLELLTVAASPAEAVEFAGQLTNAERRRLRLEGVHEIGDPEARLPGAYWVELAKPGVAWPLSVPVMNVADHGDGFFMAAVEAERQHPGFEVQDVCWTPLGHVQRVTARRGLITTREILILAGTPARAIEITQACLPDLDVLHAAELGASITEAGLTPVVSGTTRTERGAASLPPRLATAA